jgi:hypothetical protein
MVIRVGLLPGIGDIIYTWYKLDHYVSAGHSFEVLVGSSPPRRAHQLKGMLDGMESMEYVDDFGVDSRYRWVQVDDLLNPPSAARYRGGTFLHTNSFVESGAGLAAFMPSVPINYGIRFEGTTEEAAEARSIVGDSSVVLYTSSVFENSKMRADHSPEFFERCVLESSNAWGLSGDPRIVMIGAEWDAELVRSVGSHLDQKGFEVVTLLSYPLGLVTEVLRASGHAVLFESGMLMIADLVGARFLHLVRNQPERDNDRIHLSGIFNPETLASRYMRLPPDGVTSQIGKVPL